MTRWGVSIQSRYRYLLPIHCAMRLTLVQDCIPQPDPQITQLRRITNRRVLPPLYPNLHLLIHLTLTALPRLGQIKATLVESMLDLLRKDLDVDFVWGEAGIG